VSRARLLLATLAAYLPAAALPALAERDDLPGAPLDPAVLVVPFCLGFALGFPAWGRAADRRGPGPVIRAALLLAAGAGVLVAIAPEAWMLAAARGLQGLAAAGVPPAVQAALAQDAAAHRTGRALSGMMLAVAVATLAGPALAPLLADATGWTASALVLGVPLPLLLTLGRQKHLGGAFGRPRVAAAYEHARGVRAGWLVSALVLGGHWTVLTRLTEAVGPGAASIAALTGAAGLPLVVLAARSSDHRGPRQTMTATLAAGAAGFLLAATAQTDLAFIAAAGVGLAVYWAYLPVVAAQVQRSAGTAARGRAAGGLYASMWGAAAGAGLLASLASSWRGVLLGAGLAWTLAGMVAAREFLGAASSVACPPPAPQPSPR
jgi:MFS family permease